MMIEKTIGVPAPRVVPSPARDAMNETADRLVLEVVSAVDDGYTGVPECQRLIAWLGAHLAPADCGEADADPFLGHSGPLEMMSGFGAAYRPLEICIMT